MVLLERVIGTKEVKIVIEDKVHDFIEQELATES